jgi:hypothetical protein
MTNNNEKETNDDVPDCIFNSNILTEKEPIGVLQMINQGLLSRINAWKVLQLIHAGEVKCGLPQYGIITVFSLSKDIKQFLTMFDQGCDMLRDEGIIDDEFEKATFIELSKIMKKKSGAINVVNPLDKPSKTGKKKKSTNKNSKSN